MSTAAPAHNASVTVAIPTFNRSALLAVTLESVLRQEGVDLEVFVLDNASTDDTENVVRSFDDPRINYVRQMTNIGAIANMNLGLTVGSAPFLTIVHDDDVLSTGSLAARAELLRLRPDIVVAYSFYGVIDQNGGRMEDCYRWTVPTESSEDAQTFIRHSFPGIVRCHSSLALIRRSLIGDIRFSSADSSFADLGLWVRLATVGGFGFVDRTLGDVRVHNAALGLAEANFEMVDGVMVLHSVEQYVRVTGILRRLFRDRGRNVPHRLRLWFQFECFSVSRFASAIESDMLVPDRRWPNIALPAVRAQPLVAMHPRFMKIALRSALPERLLAAIRRR